MKLESLSDRKPTKEDVGKTIYKFRHYPQSDSVIYEWIIKEVDEKYKGITIRNKLLMIETVQSYDLENHYWNKPIIISEDEYNRLKIGEGATNLLRRIK